MKKGILLAVASLALAIVGTTVVTTSDAHANSWWYWWRRGPDFNQRYFGSNFVIRQNPVEGPLFMPVNRGLLFLTAKGKPGTAQFDVMSEFGNLLPGLDVCNENEVGVIFDQVFWTQTFQDGSMISGIQTPQDPGDDSEPGTGYICTSDGINLRFAAHGPIRAGRGKFAGASGTWETEGLTIQGTVKGEFTAVLD